MSRDRAPARVLVGVALVSLCVLMLQLTLTRLFSATMYYHFAFLAISLALFGAGASGVFVYVVGPRLEGRGTSRWLSRSSALFGWGTLLALLVVLGNPLSPWEPASATLLRLFFTYGASALPFFFAGCVVSVAVTRFARDISRLYLFDLGGAAAGCLLLIPVLDGMGAIDALLLVSVLAAGVALLFDEERRRWSLLASWAALTGLLAVNGALGWIGLRQAKGLEEKGNVIFARWNSFSRVTVWGSLAEESLLVMIDADAASVVSRGGTDLWRHRHMRNRVEALAYHLKPGARALILGPGGGDDVIMARLFGARSITAVEVNPIIARDVMSSETIRGYTGGVFEQPGVRLVVDEARSFIRRSEERYDVIQGTKVDTWAATAAGAFALAENNLYTVEAFEDYARHLSDDGVLSFTRWYLEPPDQLLRLVSLARAMMEELKIADAPRHVVIVRGVPEPDGERAPATFLFKKSPFTDEEVRRVEAVASGNGFGLLYTPLSRPPNDFTRLIEGPDPAEVWRAYPSDIAPTRDDSPFFFHTVRLGRLWELAGAAAEWRKTNLGTFVLFGLLVVSAVLTLAFVLGPLLLFRRRALTRDTSTKVLYLTYFGCLGAAFILVEVAMIQKCILFLGHPVYALTVVLFSLLCFSAIGSRLSGRLSEGGLRRDLARVLVVLAALIAVYVLLLSPLFAGLVHLASGYRIAITVALLAPLGLVMGVPMPTGIRIVSRAAPEIIPWGWGINGAASVLGSAAALGIALFGGFNQALLAGAGLYLLAIAFIARPEGASRLTAGARAE